MSASKEVTGHGILKHFSPGNFMLLWHMTWNAHARGWPSV